MSDATHGLPVKRQAELLDLSRSNVYYLPRPVADADLALMRRIDELHLNFRIRRVTPQRLEIQVDRLVADSYLCSLSAAPASGIRLGKKTGQTV